MTIKTPHGAPKNRTRILIVDDHPIVRQGLAQLINREADLTVCGEATDAYQAVTEIEALKPDMAIIDISLKGIDGIELIKDLKVRDPKLPVLVLSMHDESLYAQRALHAGAKGYIMKQEATETLVRAIRRVLLDEIYVSDEIQAKMLHQFADGRLDTDGSPIERLTDRELEVFQLIGHGYSTRRIAEVLHLSVKTIESYQANIKRKLNLKNATELVRHAIHWVYNESPG